MRPLNYILLCVMSISGFSCNTKPTTATLTKEQNDSILKKQETNAMMVREDSLQHLFETGKMYWRNVIRVADSSPGFMYFDLEDSTFVSLDSSNRENYYREFRRHISKDELRAQKIVWGLKEVLQQQQGDGGLYTEVSYLIDTPTTESPYYQFWMERIYPNRLGGIIDLPFINVDLKTNTMMVEEKVSGEQLSLQQWRKKGFELDKQ
jgi:hypothetical protein